MSAANTDTNANIVPQQWDATKIASQKGKRVIVTDANSGIARHGADVVLACRSEEKGNDAVHKIQQELKLSPDAGSVEFRKLDVSSLASVQRFADDYKQSNDCVDVLVNNAGIMGVKHAVTVDGYESQFATNHLGRFALTAHLFGQLKQSERARVVNLSSLTHRCATTDVNEIMTPHDKYKPFPVYQKSKLYNMLFTYELNRRLQAIGVSKVISTVAHSGFTATNLGSPMMETSNWLVRQIVNLVLMLPITQACCRLCTPATVPGVQANDYFGPDGMGALKGYPTKEEPVNVSKEETPAKALWEESERLAKHNFSI